jgi:glycerophosphoryl diester phosphodiesterase
VTTTSDTAGIDTARIDIVCHKGANKVAPENTFAAAQQAIDWGATTIEADVWTSRDGEMVVIHDSTVDRTTDGTGHVVALTTAELAALDAGGWFDPAFAGEPIPRLRDFLTWIKGRARVFLDVKFAHPQQLLDLIYASGMDRDCFLWSGSRELMGLFHELDPTMPLKVNVSSVQEIAAAQKELGARIVEIDLDTMREPLVAACRARGLEIMINAMPGDADAYRRVIAWEPDKVNLDDAALFLQTAAETTRGAGAP